MYSIDCFNYTCPGSRWKCQETHICIPEEKVCEPEITVADSFNLPQSPDCCPGTDFWLCTDNSDEDVEMCRNHTCPSGYVKDTLTEKCLLETVVCDRRDSYENGVDCESFNCPEGYIKCADMKTCVKVG